MNATIKNWSSSHAESASSQLGDAMNAKGWSAFRRKAFASFSAVDFPAFKYGLDIRSDSTRLDWESFLFDFSPIKPFLVELGDGALMCDFSTAFQKFPEQMQLHLGKQLHLEDKMESLHVAFLSSGVFVYLPPHVHVPRLIEISSALHQHSRIEHVLVVAEEGSSASILHDLHADAAAPTHPVFSSSVLEVVAKPHAVVHIGRVQDLPASNVFHFSIARAAVEADASVDLEWGEFGGELTKSEHTTMLLAPHASSSNVGVMLAGQTQQLDLFQSSRHVSPHTRSSLSARGCLDGSAKCIYNGLIRMEKEAVASQGKQSCDMLLLSPQAEADPIPSLEILNSDVKCSHAATVGRLDKEKLFYIASRGVSEEVARSIVIAGFYENLLAHFSMEALKGKCRSLLEQRLRLNAHTFEAIDAAPAKGAYV